MTAWKPPDAIDTRIVFWAYSVVAGLAGLAIVFWGPAWFLAAHPSVVRVFGAILIAAANFALGYAVVQDPADRRKGLQWFGAGHLVVLLALWPSPHRGLREPGIWLAFALLQFAALALLYFFQTTEGDPPPGSPTPLTTLFSGAFSTTVRLRSRYEQQIRQSAAMEERSRLARDLHDSIKQQLFVIQTAAATAEVRFDEDPSGARLAIDQVRQSVREAMGEMEAMLDQLRAEPLENTGLVEALKKQCEALRFRTGANVEFNPGAPPWSGSLAPGSQEAILRVAQEALSNVARHARARNVHVALDSSAGRFEFSIRDDGSGFDPNEVTRGMGVGNMRARAKEFDGEIDVASCPGWGTLIRFSVPYVVGAPGVYRRNAWLWGAALIANPVALVLTKSPLFLALGLLSAIVFTRQMIAWRRTRRLSEGGR